MPDPPRDAAEDRRRLSGAANELYRIVVGQNLTADIRVIGTSTPGKFQMQLANGSDALAVNPLRSYARREKPIQTLEERDDVFVAVIELCLYNKRHATTGMPIRKLTWWINTR